MALHSHSNFPRRDSAGSCRSGYALFTVVVFTFLVLIAGFAFFAIASYETKGALYRENSSEAFYLADGAVERARGKFLEDRAWRDGYSSEAAPYGDAQPRGEYDLTVTDTTYLGEDALFLLAEGRVENATRRIGVVVDVPPTTFGLSMLIMGDAEVKGNLCMPGSAHVNGDGDFGSHDVHLHCGGAYTEGFEILPPPIFTDPGHFPGATYYYVEGCRIGGVTHARIYDETQTDVTTTFDPDSLSNVTTWNNGTKTYTFEFVGAEVDQYFNDSTGVFFRAPGDRAVVVNFGETFGMAGNPADVRSELIVTEETVIHATLINTRFTAVADSERIVEANWFGGVTEFKKATIEPYYGVGLIPKTMMTKPGASNLVFGTEDYPCLIYATGDLDFGNANFTLRGALIVLGDYTSTGGPDIVFDDGFIENLPDYLVDVWVPGTSGTLKILSWRELAANN
jgi:hypothetical protein